MKSTMITGLAAILLLAVSCKKESALTTDKTSALALATDINGAGKYTSIFIYGQKWMTTNLAVTHYRNGDVIPRVGGKSAWNTLTTGAWCWYNNDSATGAIYGRLYNWYAVNDPRGLAPTGWHIPTAAEWDTLSTHLGKNAGGKLKDTGTIFWLPPNTGANNKSGFTALGGSFRDFRGSFDPNGIGYSGYWWSSTQLDITNASCFYLDSYSGKTFMSPNDMRYGFSIRCIRDN